MKACLSWAKRVVRTILFRPIECFFGYVCECVISRSFNPFMDENIGLENLCGKSLFSWIYFHHHYIVGKDNHFLGVRSLKNPMDAWVYQEIIYEVKPDIILEIGNKEGGTALYFAVLLDMIGNGKVLALDIDHSPFRVEHPRIEMITGSSWDKKIVQRIHDECKGLKVLIIQDADHTREGVLRDLRLYEKLVTPSSYFVIEDTIEGFRGFVFDAANRYRTFLRPNRDTALQGVEEFLSENNRFVADRTREKWILTANYKGFLKCIAESG
jgi:cephalosporin hydroxylase